MSFLDNLENNLKALENAAERDPAEIARRREAVAAAKAAALAAAPFAKELKEGAFSKALLEQVMVIGHSLRTKVRLAWVEHTLRLEAKEKRLDLTPTAHGVEARYFVDGTETRHETVDLQQDPQAFAERWLKS